MNNVARQAQESDVQPPRLAFFYSPTSGRCRRIEAHLAHAFQRRHNHDAFRLVRVNVDERPDLAKRFQIAAVPTFLVIEGQRIVRRIVAPSNGLSLERELADWLR